MAAMDELDRELIDADLLGVDLRLRDEVPKATALELDRIKLRATAAHATRGRATRRGELMRSRIAVTMMLVAGFLMAGSGAALAVSGISGAGSAGTHEYPAENIGGQQGAGGQQGVLGAGGQGGANQATQGAAQAARQVEVTGGDNGLPFTGFAAIPLLLVGVGLAGAGFAFRRAAAERD
jgi:hypothetical protein